MVTQWGGGPWNLHESGGCGRKVSTKGQVRSQSARSKWAAATASGLQPRSFGGGGMGGCARAPKGACVQKAEAHHFQQQALVLVNSGDVTTAVSMA